MIINIISILRQIMQSILTWTNIFLFKNQVNICKVNNNMKYDADYVG